MLPFNAWRGSLSVAEGERETLHEMNPLGKSWIKICGIKDQETARALVALGVNALGLNFYAPSPRSVIPEIAAEITATLPESCCAVGLFVNHPLRRICEIIERVGLKTVQLHGEEPPEMLAELADLAVIRALRWTENSPSQIERELRLWERLGVRPWAYLVDAAAPGQFGGTGQQLDWSQLAKEYPYSEAPRLILAGGLTPANVASAMQMVHPFGVDVASGVEKERGVKDLDLCQQFVERARQTATPHIGG